jgi:hypothetical protein
MIYNKHNYLNKNLKYIKNAIIREYDMKNAGLSILKHLEIISIKEYNKLMNNYEKHERDMLVGKFLGKNSDVSQALMEGFIDARKEFFEVNDIQDDEVLSIKKDAIFLINKIPKIEQVNDDYLFRKKNEYTTYINLRGKEFYYDILSDNYDIKGFQEEIYNKQKNYLFEFVKECLKLHSENKKDELFVKLLEFKNDFVKRNLPIEYYRDITENCFLFNHNGIYLSLEETKDINSEYLFIDNNLNFILELISNILS